MHIYFGDGKGKTSAALGLALRALGSGFSVCFAGFMKARPSGEIEALRRFENARVLRSDVADPRFLNELSPSERAEYLAGQRRLFLLIGFDADVIVLDEVFSAISCGALSEAELRAFLDRRPPSVEIILTGRDPGAEILKRADYITRMEKVAHPYDRGVPARRGIEY
ncbi:MAG: cob(I)yrinic acid a,c-diamide adenosyltransferase [Clostridiales bacterium]|nr:cob(I)yrinic acid a,c-diamide adenosyltransferase [Clostridiales bacterium]